MNLNNVIESKKFILVMKNVLQKYFEYGPRSSKKVDEFHNYIKVEIDKYINENNLTNYKCMVETNIPAINSSGKKKCDIVLFKNNNAFIVIPVKIIMTSFKKNKNNYWENLTGELSHIKWAHNNIFLIPINVFINIIPVLDKNSKIKQFEQVDKDIFEIYNSLIKYKLAHNVLNYIIKVKHNNSISEIYNKSPDIICLSNPYINIIDIIDNIIKS